MNDLQKTSSLSEAAYRLADEIRDGKWRHIADLAQKPVPACEEIIAELMCRCPGFQRLDYQRAIAEGLHASR